ncbi:hypothetical protein B566_EDAN009253 [Ephemera danica]|nr:hypothetical protein B566_EDAN009253 [Ephemera danica]
MIFPRLSTPHGGERRRSQSVSDSAATGYFRPRGLAPTSGAFVVAMVITVSYMVNHDVEDETNSTDITPLNQTDLQNLISQTWPRSDTQAGSPKILWATENLDGALKSAQVELQTRDQMETTNPAVPLPPTHPSSLHRKSMFSSSQAGQAARVGTILLAATRSFSKNGQWSGGRGPQLPPSDWMSPQWCPAADHVPECPRTPFRSLDGTCNNLDNPEYGVAMRPFRRGLPANYGDGISSPRKATDGSELPNAREVSLTVHRPLYRNDPKFTVMLAVWGQFTDHDFTATALSQRKDGTAITCCNSKWQHPECYPVQVMKEDPFYAQYNVTCIDFVRSAAAPTCSLGPREQLNQVTPYIDGSVVYGGDVEMAMDLRTFQGGLLKSSRSPDGRELLPEDRAPNDGCNLAEESARGRYCFKSESRRIVAAQMQHVTFNEFLPIVLGRELSDKLELTPKTSGYYHGYDSSINIQIANEFAASAFRFGHTLLQGLLKMIANDTASPDYVQMHKMLFNPFGLYESGYMASTVRGALHTDIQKADTYFSEEVSQKLFQPKAGPCGLDLVSLNVQRGRDHGLQPYVAWRELCGLSRPSTFEDLKLIMDPDTVTRLASMYKSVDDIDMYTGIVSENPMEASGLLGATATCIITDQFVRFKRGDRFWYETPEAPQAFTPEQLDEVRKTTLSSLLCDNTDSLTEVQPFSMRAITPENPVTKCSELPRPDLSAWAERPRVRLVGSSQGVKPIRLQFVPTAEEHYHEFEKDPTTHVHNLMVAPRRQQLVIGATVVSGNITGSYGAGDLLTVWNGKLPAAIPYPYLDYPTPNQLPFPVPKPGELVYRGGFLWGGRIEVVSANTLRLSANYHLPITPLGTGSKSVREWWCGEAELEFKVNWNSTELYDIPENNYFTPAMFKQVKTGTSEFMSLFEEESNVDGEFVDSGTFRWSGNLTAIIKPTAPRPTMIQPPKRLQISAGDKTYYKYTPSWKRAKDESLVVGATVTAGTITGSFSLDDLDTVWSGGFPAAIPAPFLYKPKPRFSPGQAPQSTPDRTEQRGGALWGGNIKITSATTLHLSANYHLPLFANSTEQQWWCGEVELDMNINWNTSELHGLPQGDFFSLILFRKTYENKNENAFFNLFAPEAGVPRLQATTDRAPLDPNLVPHIPMILQGEYNEDNTIFWWNGEVTLVFPKEAPSPQLKAAYSGRAAFGGTVTSGSVVLESGMNLWSGSVPQDISTATKAHGKDFLHGGSSILSGAFVTTGDSSVTTLLLAACFG